MLRCLNNVAAFTNLLLVTCQRPSRTAKSLNSTHPNGWPNSSRIPEPAASSHLERYRLHDGLGSKSSIKLRPRYIKVPLCHHNLPLVSSQSTIFITNMMRAPAPPLHQPQHQHNTLSRPSPETITTSSRKRRHFADSRRFLAAYWATTPIDERTDSGGENQQPDGFSRRAYPRANTSCSRDSSARGDLERVYLGPRVSQDIISSKKPSLQASR